MSRSNFRQHLATHYPGPVRPDPASGGAVLTRGPASPPLAGGPAPVGGRSAGPEGAGGPLSGAPPGGRPADRSAAPAPSLPDFKRAASIQPELIVRPPVLVEGLLHRGCKALLSGASKAFKSWVLIDLAVSIATGRPWWGFACSPGVVIYLNFELIEPFFDHRIVSVCQAKGVPLPHDLLLWNLRAHCYDLGVLAKVLAARLADAGPVAALIVDPIYKALGDLDENSAGDMTKLMNLVETLAAPLGAAVIFGSHFSKGNPTGKEAKDRPSGSGVLIRDPDVVLVMTRHEEDDCYTIDAELRYLPRLSPFVVRWTFPLMTPDESLDPRRLYGLAREILGDDEAAGRNARPPGFTEDDMLQCLPRTGAQDVLWRKLVALRFGRAGPDYYARKAALLAAGRVRKHGLKFYPADLTLDRPIDVPPTAVHYDEEAP